MTISASHQKSEKGNVLVIFGLTITALSIVLGLAFQPINKTPLNVKAVDESPPLDVILVIDTSESMTWGWSDNRKTEAERDPKICNEDDPDGAVSGDGIDGSCSPFQDIKQAAINFIKRLRFPHDRVGIVSFNQYATVSLPLSDDPAALEAAIQNLRVYEGMGQCQYYRDDPALNQMDPTSQSPVPPLPYTSAVEITGPCRLLNAPEGGFLGMDCPMAYGPSPSLYMCGNTNTGAGFIYANNALAGVYPGSVCATNCPSVRDNSLRVMIVLSDGAPNSAFDSNGAPICPGYTQTWAWFNDSGQACRDKDSTVRHAASDPLYDADDYARDMIDLAAQNNTLIYTVGMGSVALMRPGWIGDPPGQALLQYAATTGKGDYYFVETPDQLDTSFLDISTKLSAALPPGTGQTAPGSDDTPSPGITPTVIFEPADPSILTSTPASVSTSIAAPGATPASDTIMPSSLTSTIILIGCASMVIILLGILVFAMRKKKL